MYITFLAKKQISYLIKLLLRSYSTAIELKIDKLDKKAIFKLPDNSRLTAAIILSI